MITRTLVVTYKHLFFVRCACDRPFVVSQYKIDKAVKNGKLIACHNCLVKDRYEKKEPKVQKQRQTEPQTPAAKEAVRLLLELDRDPTFKDLKTIGKKVGIVPQSVEKLWLRWVVLPERNRLRQLLAGGQGCNNSCSHARHVPESSNSR